MMKIAVTSASGHLGAAIVKALIEEIGTEHVVAIARTPEKAMGLGVEVRKGDYNNPADFEHALKDVDKLLLVSGMDAPEKRIQQHRNVIEAARSNGVSKLVYTSIIGDEEGNAFSPVVRSNRRTEEDIRSSGLEWAIGRNGIYIEPDLDYLNHYIQEGVIRNSAAKGKCAYTSRAELGFAYAQMLLRDEHHGQTYNLVGEAISQFELAGLINEVFGTELTYQTMSVESYQEDRKAELGDFLGEVVAGIYEGIRSGAYDIYSDYHKASGRCHLSPKQMMENYHHNTYKK
ncbi:SDR family oxidoreductase [Dyadobacter tibetensis]|uniref:SDR family oxidoreductase n=1 Tax=Dyadobacter tibetensis TaxID=1211851 RepID=UPI0004B2A694|nr:SDR family oxidoreductase [Dyadobacter tibetensis]